MSSVAAQAGAPSAQTPKRAGLVLLTLILSAFVCNVNLSIANVALPDIGRALDASQTSLTLIATGCTLGLAMSVLYFGAIGDRYGRKQMLMLGLLLTVPASALCAWAPNAHLLAAGRLLTGLAAGMAFPTTLALITALWAPGAKRMKAIGLWTGIGGGAAILGPVIAGVLLESFWWGSVFLIAVPFAIVALILVIIAVPAHVNESTDRVDHLGGVISVLMIAALVLGLGLVSSPNLLAVALSLLIVGLALVVAFFLRERLARFPLFNLHYAKRRLFWVSALAGMIVFGSLMGGMFVGQQFMQNVLGFSTVIAGFAVLPGAIGMGIMSGPSARLVDSLGSRATMLLGYACVIPAFVIMLAVWKEGTSIWWVLVTYLLIGMGAGLVMTASSHCLTGSVPVTNVGMSSATTDLQRDLGGSILQSMLGVMLTLGYSAEFTRQIAASSQSSQVDAQTKAALLQSFSSATNLAERYPDYQSAIVSAARTSFLDGANLAYGLALVAVVLGALLVATRFPGKAREAALMQSYQQEDAAISA